MVRARVRVEDVGGGVGDVALARDRESDRHHQDETEANERLVAPHVAEQLWLALGNAQDAAQTPWPGVSFQVPA